MIGNAHFMFIDGTGTAMVTIGIRIMGLQFLLFAPALNVELSQCIEGRFKMNICGEYFYGNKISNYGLEHGFVDYGTLAKAFDAVLNNDLMVNTYEIGYWEPLTGTIDNDDEIEEQEEFQWYIVSDSGATILQEINEVVYYNETLDIYLWGVTHFGTSWDYVLTNIPCNTGKM